ncbi:hypothetical protein BDA96_02G166100 [Sorghum bicolor]|uniref:V-SNARE coiled-coil homology domain-containing protein n=2 Tax=Sorghum bicolor TaxID=4558 RepID=A0A1B6QBN7_SORBI|nr:uncharacterized protein LOC110433042 [Sorghum bicolor]XP_021310302.1 uncharacterized protein LOC110433042 [Sorghum bicolor]KAG0543160.1 hypothetical protein BDA96_02G166100 [Sorghum bicolor]KAG0543161.1 hypothetical protein BDA96_02G166100 [Sorghum bicolor]KAG0543162.1 hypothetical protein BDA96_02G166100 [Sorghum bicolor]KXG35337.1 hypothetical protein SORBI_3002G159700 [Sorghum bicolor]KXG35338.1 hypothetical protein SORBI_3002G159700 [Sorghum bicolor]|eukprot:XP_021310301.1 uncharacterized protein LOC110433042 [Sorghum bicolor]
MALRSLLLLRIQGVVLPSTKGPRTGLLSGLSPAAATTRFMGTKSQCEHRFPTTIAEAEQRMTQLRDSIKAMQQETIKDQQKLREELTEFDKNIRREFAEVSSSADKARKVGSAFVAAVLGTPLLLIFMSKYQPTD